ncbi:heme exporter protein CcmB [Quisquiliibacterium transsilvanicum]|uniref:Heme exporter protein B n=1 Tax=Quisquiliibacterium transsilvanicum TaxID=1549638 RepID=A0A7W8HJ23_9BURK|nr:heme exporter protein CcmB [Quisquiliibacterium transsilvanicum]MBB5272316.1 heme exporter protein B [Quisquiliibacterium transsilvanicum]
MSATSRPRGGAAPADAAQVGAMDAGSAPAGAAPVTRDPVDALSAIAWACRRDLVLAMRSRSELALVLVFFVLVISLFPLGVSPDPTLLARIAPGIAWVAALLASLLSLSRLFAADHADGSLEQLVLAPAALPALVAGKVLAHWLTNGLPLVLLAPLAGIQFGMQPEAIVALTAGLALGTPTLSWLGAIGAALTLGTRAGSALLALLVLPLAVPILIFGSGAAESVNSGLGAGAHLSLLGAGLLASSVLGPFATAVAVRIAYE